MKKIFAAVFVVLCVAVALLLVGAKIRADEVKGTVMLTGFAVVDGSEYEYVQIEAKPVGLVYTTHSVLIHLEKTQGFVLPEGWTVRAVARRGTPEEK